MFAGRVADSMKARPAGGWVQSVAGRSGLFSGCELRFLLDVVYLLAGSGTTYSVFGLFHA